jgi:hypothetical protein
MRKYKYKGEEEREVPQIGRIVKPGETIETDKEINHPLFELVKEEKKKNK